jgi:hypothetical protein
VEFNKSEELRKYLNSQYKKQYQKEFSGEIALKIMMTSPKARSIRNTSFKR